MTDEEQAETKFGVIVDNSKPVTETPLIPVTVNFNPDQERDVDGRWAAGGSRGSISPKRKEEIKKLTPVKKGWEESGVRPVFERMLQANPRLTNDGMIKARKAAEGYLGGSSRQMNSVLRQGGSSQQTTQAIMFFSACEPMDKGSVVVRGMNLKEDSIKDMFKKGQIFTDRGFMSTTNDSEQALEFAHKGGGSRDRVPVMMKLTDKRGLGRVVPDDLLKYEGEQEILYPPGTRVKITEVKAVKNKWTDIRIYTLIKGEIL